MAAWDRDTGTWPKDRGLRTFRKWFEAHVVELVIDLDEEPLVGETL
ncbi:MAG TPA: hypothetical protein QGH10_17305 [Armatimonadota bacterium]|nr:hypothetical protein [Armatimonadota bacterium]